MLQLLLVSVSGAAGTHLTMKPEAVTEAFEEVTAYPLAKLLFPVCVCVCVEFFFSFKERCRCAFSSVRSLWKINGGDGQFGRRFR